MNSVVTSLICSIIEDKLERGTPGSILKFTFELGMDYERFYECSYHNMELIVWRPGNYTMVAVRKILNAIELNDMDWERENKMFLKKPNAEYTVGKTEWKLFSYHDSTWRTDGIERVVSHLSTKEKNVHLATNDYQLIEVDAVTQEKLINISKGGEEYRRNILTLHELFNHLKQKEKNNV
jgi:hypothetical protein